MLFIVLHLFDRAAVFARIIHCWIYTLFHCVLLKHTILITNAFFITISRHAGHAREQGFTPKCSTWWWRSGAKALNNFIGGTVFGEPVNRGNFILVCSFSGFASCGLSSAEPRVSILFIHFLGLGVLSSQHLMNPLFFCDAARSARFALRLSSITQINIVYRIF